MSRPPLEVADLIRTAGDCFHRTKSPLAQLEARQSAAGHCALSYRRTWRASRRVHPLRASRHLLQLLPQPALPEVSDLGAGTVDRRTSERTSPDALRPCGLHAPPRVGATGPAEQKGPLRSCCSAPVPKPFSKSLAIPDTSARKSASSACCIPGVRNSSFTPMSIASFPPAACRSITRAGLNRATASFFPSRCSAAFSAASSLPALKGAFREGQLRFHGNLTRLARAENLRRLAHGPCSEKTGWSTSKPPFRWPRICAPVSGPLHPSRGHLQPSPGLLCRWQSHFPLARLRSPQRTEVDDPFAR